MPKALIKKMLSTALVGTTLLYAAHAEAQTRVQREILNDQDATDAIILRDENIDYQMEMRDFVKKLARWARQYNKAFKVLIKDDTGLLTQVVDIDLLIQSPSVSYIKALDGLLLTDLSYGNEEYGKPSDPKIAEKRLQTLETAKRARLNIFSVDSVSKPADVDKAYRFALKNNFIPYARPGKGPMNNALTNWPKRPIHENSHTVTTLNEVKNFAYVEDSSAYGTRDIFAMKMHQTNYDMLVLNVFHHRFTALSKQNIETMKYKKLGSKRLVLATMNIGTANSGLYYWQDAWEVGNPSWIIDYAPMKSDELIVEYWNPAWQQIFYGNAQSYLYGIIDQGFDGVVLEGVDAYKLFETP